jgi:uncharacterized membrane protein
MTMNESTPPSESEVHRIDGRLHLVHYVTDSNGRRHPVVTGPLKVEFRLEDLGQLVAGACVMGLPVVFTGEVWDLGNSLGWQRTVMILLFSVLTMGAFIWGLFYGKRITEYPGSFLKRAGSCYLVAFTVSFLLLFLIDKAPLDDLGVALTRTVLVAFPASFAATAVDFMK